MPTLDDFCPAPMTLRMDLPRWNFFRLLEADLEATFRYVQPIPAHYCVTSDEFARVILQAGVETEHVLRELCHALGRTPARDSIRGWWTCIEPTFPRLRETELGIPRYAMDGLRPWAGWSSEAGPEWWAKGYNKVKHDRAGHPEAPSLRNAVDAVGGLLVALLYRYRALTPPSTTMPAEMAPRLFDLKSPDHGWIGSGMWAEFPLPDDPPPA